MLQKKKRLTKRIWMIQTKIIYILCIKCALHKPHAYDINITTQETSYKIRIKKLKENRKDKRIQKFRNK